MGLNYHKSVKIDDNTKLNINKNSASVSVGKKGVRHTVSTSGRRTTTIGLPGTGLSYTMTSGGKSGKKKKQTAAQRKRSRTVKTAVSVICSVVAIIFVIIAVCKYFGVGSSSDKSGGLSWRKDEYTVSVGGTETIILDVEGADKLENADASDFDIDIDNDAAVRVELKKAYSETVHFTVTGLEAGTASVKITYNGEKSNGVTVSVSE